MSIKFAWNQEVINKLGLGDQTWVDILVVGKSRVFLSPAHSIFEQMVKNVNKKIGILHTITQLADDRRPSVT